MPGGIPVAFGALRLRAARRLPVAYGWLTHQQIERDAEDSYVLPVLTRGEIRRDLRRLLGGIKPSQTLDAAARLTSFNRPVLIAWSADDRFFPLEHAERLARLLPDARLEWIEGRVRSAPRTSPSGSPS